MKSYKTIISTIILLGFFQNSLAGEPKADAVGTYCAGLKDSGRANPKDNHLGLTGEEDKMHNVLMSILAEPCLLAEGGTMPSDVRKKINNLLKEAGYPSEFVSELFPFCQGESWTKTKCIDIYNSIYEKKAQYIKAEVEAYKKKNEDLGY